MPRAFHYFSDGKILAFWIFPVKESGGNPDLIGKFDILSIHFYLILLSQLGRLILIGNLLSRR